MGELLKIGFAATCMNEFDAVLDVDDVREKELPDIGEPAYITPMKEWLGTYGTVVGAELVGDKQTARKANCLFRENGIDVLVVHEFAFTLADTFARLVESLDIPIVFWNTQMSRHMEKTMDFGMVMANNSVSSVPHSTNYLFQEGRPFQVITGLAGEEHTELRFRQILSAVEAKKKLSSSRVAAIGYVYPGMTTISVNETSFTQRFGIDIEHVNPVEIKNFVKNANQQLVEQYVSEMKETYLVEGLNDKELHRAAACRVAFETLISRKQIDAVALLCGLLILEKDMGVAPCYALSKLAEQGYPCSCECDIPAVTALLIAQQITGAAHFTEFYMMDMERELLMMSHCGYGNPALANPNRPVKMVPQPCFPGPCGSGAAFEYTAKPGEITILSITDSPQGYKIVAAAAECVDLPSFATGCPQIIVKFKNKTLAEGVERYCKAGGSHHMVVCYGNIKKELEILAEILGVDFEGI